MSRPKSSTPPGRKQEKRPARQDAGEPRADKTVRPFKSSAREKGEKDISARMMLLEPPRTPLLPAEMMPSRRKPPDIPKLARIGGYSGGETCFTLGSGALPGEDDPELYLNSPGFGTHTKIIHAGLGWERLASHAQDYAVRFSPTLAKFREEYPDFSSRDNEWLRSRFFELRAKPEQIALEMLDFIKPAGLKEWWPKDIKKRLREARRQLQTPASGSPRMPKFRGLNEAAAKVLAGKLDATDKEILSALQSMNLLPKTASAEGLAVRFSKVRNRMRAAGWPIPVK